jgi:hypothetical protein
LSGVILVDEKTTISSFSGCSDNTEFAVPGVPQPDASDAECHCVLSADKLLVLTFSSEIPSHQLRRE